MQPESASRVGMMARPLILLPLCLVAAAVLLAARLDPDTQPTGDDIHYLAIAHHLIHHQTFSKSEVADDPRPPWTSYREPLYPLLLAGLMGLDTDLRQNALRCIDPEAADCGGVYTSVIYANAALHLLSGLIVWLSVARLMRRKIWCVAAFAFTVANPPLWRFVGRAFSDPLSMFVSAALGYALLRAYQTRSARWSIASGVALGALILCKAAFLYFAFSLALGFIVVGLWRFRFRTIPRKTLANALLVAGVAGTLVVPWMLRNYIRTGEFEVASKNRAAALLAIRAHHNGMSAVEYAAAFPYWTRGPLRPLARSVLQRFPESAYLHLIGKFDGEPNYESYYRRGWDEMNARRAELRAAGFSMREAQEQTFEECLARILDHPLKHVLVSIPIGYRGINGDFFWIITAPAFLLLFLSALRNRRWEYLWLVSPGLFGLVFHAGLTDFYPRFIAPSIPALAISGALGLAALSPRRKNAHTEAR